MAENSDKPPFVPSIPGADVILRSSDQVDFPVHKLFLSAASTVFRDMFLLPHGTDENSADDGLPVVDVTEESSTWDMVLRLCYPEPFEGVREMDTVWPIMEAARKYHMEGLTKRIGDTLLIPHFLEKYPLRVYALACAYRLDDLARKAARLTLRENLGELAYTRDLQCATAAAYHRLMQYRQECCNVSKATCTEGSLIQLERVYLYACFWAADYRPLCKCSFASVAVITAGGTYHYTATYWSAYLDSARAALLARPAGDVVKARAMLEPMFREAGKCDKCGPRIYADAMNITELLAQEVERRVSLVNLVID